MAATKIIDNEFVTLYCDIDNQIIHHIYRGKVSGDVLKKALNTGTDYLIKHNLTKWLSDNRASEGHTDEDSQWINEVWLPRTIKAGWKYWALVVPETIIARMDLVKYVESFYEQGVHVRVTPDPDEAMEWLLNIDKT